jgi:NitT/TauT family transport system substrate-binding protein
MKRIAAATILCAAVLTGCSSTESEGGEGQSAAETLELTVGHLVNGGQTPVYVADTEGFFADEGLKVTREQFTEAPVMVAALQRGDIDMISSIPGPMQAAAQSGFPLVTFMQQETAGFEAPDSGAVIVAADSPIETVKDLEGKRVGGIGGRSYVMTADLFAILDEAGADPEKVTIVDVPFPSHIDALRTGQVDAVITVNPFTTQIQSEGVGRVISWLYLDSNPGQPLSSWWSKREWVEENEEIVASFQAAMKDSIDWLREDDARARDVVAEFTGLNRALLEEMPINRWAYEVDEEAWRKQTEILFDYGALPKPQELDEIWAPQMREFVQP